ncbi:MAG: hypothetical protein K0R09_3586 [Clostridiales bacterium]|jgi:hypothetical protein|nr:hypothetical protein [Clostridiales bacterium]
MIIHIDIFNETKVEVTDAGKIKGNFKKIAIIEGTSSTELVVDEENYKELVFTQVTALNFKDKLDLIKQLAEEVGGIHDFDNPDYKLSEVYFDEDIKEVFVKFEKDGEEE